MEMYECSASPVDYDGVVTISEDDPIFRCLNDPQRILNFYLGSKPSVFEVYNKHVVKLLRYLPQIEYLLEMFRQRSNLDRVLIMDVRNGFTICGDRGPLDFFTYQITWEVIKSWIQFSIKYSYEDRNIFNDTFACDVYLTNEPPDNYKQRTNDDNIKDMFVVAVRGINRFLALTFIIRAENYTKKDTIQLNFENFRHGLTQLMSLYARNSSLLDSSDEEESLI